MKSFVIAVGTNAMQIATCNKLEKFMWLIFLYVHFGAVMVTDPLHRPYSLNLTVIYLQKDKTLN